MSEQESQQQITEYRAWCAEQGFTVELVEVGTYGDVSVNHRAPDGTRYCWRYLAPKMIDASSIGYKPKGCRNWREPIWPEEARHA